MSPVRSVFRLSVAALSSARLVARDGVDIAPTVSGTVCLSWPASRVAARDTAVEITPHEARRLAAALLDAADHAESRPDPETEAALAILARLARRPEAEAGEARP